MLPKMANVDGRAIVFIGLMRMLAIEIEQLSPFDVRLLRTICQLQRDLQRPVPSRLLSEMMAVPDRTMRYYLRRMEQQYLLTRPRGPNSGYQAARPRIMPIIRQHEERWSGENMAAA